MPNVGDQVALSPDGSQVWTNGADTCSRPDYPHDGCPFVPSKVINALRVSDDPRLTLQPLKTFGFSLVEFNGRISISPQGEVFIGGGIEIKRIDPHLSLIHIWRIRSKPMRLAQSDCSCKASRMSRDSVVGAWSCQAVRRKVWKSRIAGAGQAERP